ncbi:MAG TPA: hypothetical protein PLC54_04735, partial [Spirochaetales bacterium]|nr:hypothetical protein [Spirochaetales bacterium]
MHLVGCAKQATSFQMVLARIDAHPAVYNTSLFATAARLAGSTEQRLRVLKRANQRGTQAGAEVASLILEHAPVSEPVAFAIAS